MCVCVCVCERERERKREREGLSGSGRNKCKSHSLKVMWMVMLNTHNVDMVLAIHIMWICRLLYKHNVYDTHDLDILVVSTLCGYSA